VLLEGVPASCGRTWNTTCQRLTIVHHGIVIPIHKCVKRKQKEQKTINKKILLFWSNLPVYKESSKVLSRLTTFAPRVPMGNITNKGAPIKERESTVESKNCDEMRRSNSSEIATSCSHLERERERERERGREREREREKKREGERGERENERRERERKGAILRTRLDGKERNAAIQTCKIGAETSMWKGARENVREQGWNSQNCNLKSPLNIAQGNGTNCGKCTSTTT
jgi:hypothetical protein